MATVGLLSDDGFVTHRAYEDFSERLIVDNCRVTSKSVEAQQLRAETMAREYVAMLIERYK